MFGDDKALFEKSGRSFEAGATIFTEGEPGNEMYLIKSGRVKVIRSEKTGSKVLSVFGAGNLFGEMALIEAKPRSATVVAMEKTEVLVLTFSDLEQIISSKPEFLFKLIQVLCKRIRFTTGQIRNYAIKSAPGKVSDILITLTDSFNYDSEQTNRLDLGIGALEISQMTGLGLEEVRSTLDNFSKEGLVDAENEHSISITNIDGLKNARYFLLKKEHFHGII
ncbi:MAG: Crp/Fnr family transcriptional regulator [Firmicutes bacterium]|nr:Crp/Fnr family transcriptional regulator [Bacillota bacterium]